MAMLFLVRRRIRGKSREKKNWRKKFFYPLKLFLSVVDSLYEKKSHPLEHTCNNFLYIFFFSPSSPINIPSYSMFVCFFRLLSNSLGKLRKREIESKTKTEEKNKREKKPEKGN